MTGRKSRVRLDLLGRGLGFLEGDVVDPLLLEQGEDAAADGLARFLRGDGFLLGLLGAGLLGGLLGLGLGFGGHIHDPLSSFLVDDLGRQSS